MMFIRGTSCPPFGSDESVKSVINYSISVDSVLSVDYLFSTEDTDKHGFLFCVFCVFCGLSFSHGWSRIDVRKRTLRWSGMPSNIQEFFRNNFPDHSLFYLYLSFFLLRLWGKCNNLNHLFDLWQLMSEERCNFAHRILVMPAGRGHRADRSAQRGTIHRGSGNDRTHL